MGRRSHSVLSPEFVDSDMDIDDTGSDSEKDSSDSSSSSQASESASAQSSLSLAIVPTSVSDVPSSPLKTVNTIADKSFVGNAGSSKSHHDKAKANKGKKGKNGALFFILPLCCIYALLTYLELLQDEFGLSLDGYRETERWQVQTRAERAINLRLYQM